VGLPVSMGGVAEKPAQFGNMVLDPVASKPCGNHLDDLSARITQWFDELITIFSNNWDHH
jgi:hypothetical protein